MLVTFYTTFVLPRFEMNMDIGKGKTDINILISISSWYYIILILFTSFFSIPEKVPGAWNFLQGHFTIFLFFKGQKSAK